MPCLWINGESRESSARTVGELLEELGVGSRRVAVEVNGEIVARSAREAHALGESDRVEIVNAVGGG